LVIQKYFLLSIIESHRGRNKSGKNDNPFITIAPHYFYFRVEHLELIFEEIPELANIERVGDIRVMI